MRRAEIVEGIQAVVSAITESGILKALMELTRRGAPTTKENSKVQVLDALRKYTLAAHNFNPAARAVARHLSLHPLEDPEVWEGLLTQGDSPIAFHLRDTVRFATNNVPKLLPLLAQAPLQEIERVTEDGATKYKGMRTLTITLYEDKNAFSSPTRVANAIESINHFYYACAMIGGESPTTISVIACDSGSDKSFDFLGLAKVMECVERILNSIWERVFFFREHQLEERLDLVAKSLPIIKQISEMKEHNEIDPELAKLLTNNVFEGVNKFIQTGVSTPEIENTSHYNPRALLSPVQRLLVSAPEGESGTVEEAAEIAETGGEQDEERPTAGEVSIDGLNPDEQELLRRLLSKATRARPAASADVVVEAENVAPADEPPDDKE